MGDDKRAIVQQRCGAHSPYGHECDLIWCHLDSHESLDANGNVHESWPAPRCRSDYHTDTNQHPFSHPSRSIHCELPKGHDGDHDEMIDGEPGVVTWPKRKVPPQTWNYPGKPGPEVTRLRDFAGDYWVRLDDGCWGDEAAAQPNHMSWMALLERFGPLTDATAEVSHG